MRDKWIVGDICEARIGDDWEPGIIQKLYEYFAEVRVGDLNHKHNVIKVYSQLRRANDGYRTDDNDT